MVGFMNVALRTDVADPLERLQAVHDEAQRSKAYAEALGPRIAMDVTDVMPGGMLNLAMRAAQRWMWRVPMWVALWNITLLGSMNR